MGTPRYLRTPGGDSITRALVTPQRFRDPLESETWYNNPSPYWPRHSYSYIDPVNEIDREEAEAVTLMMIVNYTWIT